MESPRLTEATEGVANNSERIADALERIAGELSGIANALNNEDGELIATLDDIKSALEQVASKD